MFAEPNSFLFLLLPLAAASGWYLARRRLINQHQQINKVTKDTMEGLRHLAKDRPDKAIEAWTKLSEVDDKNVDILLALASLFRRRGEVDKALKVHQKLIEREKLAPEHRLTAQYELAIDYMNAGVLDRAENIFKELSREGSQVVPALEQLKRIYEQQNDWELAIRTLRDLEAATTKPQDEVMAQYHCELAAEALREGTYTEAHRLLKHALVCSRRCARASMMLGQLAERTHDFAGAEKAYRKAITQDANALYEVLPALHKVCAQQNRLHTLADLLREIHSGSGCILSSLWLSRMQLDDNTGARLRADEHINQQTLTERPNLNSLHEWVSDQATQHTELSAIQKALAELIDRQPKYRCCNCGFTGHSVHWQCPSCLNWNSVEPLQDVVAIERLPATAA